MFVFSPIILIPSQNSFLFYLNVISSEYLMTAILPATIIGFNSAGGILAVRPGARWWSDGPGTWWRSCPGPGKSLRHLFSSLLPLFHRRWRLDTIAFSIFLYKLHGWVGKCCTNKVFFKPTNISTIIERDCCLAEARDSSLLLFALGILYIWNILPSVFEMVRLFKIRQPFIH